jgi:hypothetical protein
MTPKQTDQDYSDGEVKQRRDKALSAALSMPRIPHAESSPKKPKKRRKAKKA